MATSAMAWPRSRWGPSAALASVRYRLRFQKTIQVYLLLPFTIPLVVSGLSTYAMRRIGREIRS